jgi:hypothetical protein
MPRFVSKRVGFGKKADRFTSSRVALGEKLESPMPINPARWPPFLPGAEILLKVTLIGLHPASVPATRGPRARVPPGPRASGAQPSRLLHRAGPPVFGQLRRSPQLYGRRRRRGTAGLTIVPDGNLYGATVAGFCNRLISIMRLNYDNGAAFLIYFGLPG